MPVSVGRVTYDKAMPVSHKSAMRTERPPNGRSYKPMAVPYKRLCLSDGETFSI